MSFDEYVHHIAQKYRLAVAISVIKTKPNNLSTEEYLAQLRTKIKDMEFDANETVCSDDFNFDNDDIVSEKNQQNSHSDTTECVTTNERGLTCQMEYNIAPNETQLNISVNENDSQGSQTILNDFIFANELERNIERKDPIRDTINLLKEVTTGIQEKPNANQNLSQLTFCASQEPITKTNNDITYCNTTNSNNVSEINNIYIQNYNENNMDSQETQLYTLHGFTQSYTHVSQTQGENFVVPGKYIRNKASHGNDVQENAYYINQQNGSDMQMIVNASQNMLTQNEFAIADKEVGNSIYLSQNNVNLANDIGNAQLLQGCSKDVQDFTGISRNSAETIGKVSHNVVEHVVEQFDYSQTFELNIHNIIDELTCNSNDVFKDKEINMAGTNIKNVKTDVRNSTPLLSLDNQNTPKEFIAANNTMPNIGQQVNNIQYSKDNHQESNNATKMNQNHSINSDQQPIEVNVNIQNQYEMDVDESGSDENQQERVPFKVLEELNRVKGFLNRKDRRNHDGYSTDSGYRSDSRLRSSLKSSSQVSGTPGAWLNQSAHCLFHHIVRVTGTDDIVKEIAQVLGQLIDRLHEEENYPQFLDELLETVEGMLRELHEDGSAENLIITKDENIQRLILLNKSKHILQYTIEKITAILEDLHTNLAQENLYESKKIVELENICYIFHILEIFLKKYVKVKDISSQSTQNSQEDFPKKSSLTDLWRKKWNPSRKEIVKNESKPCTLKRCSEILNKLIVECMNGYSLVAFAALQCFNLIQV